MMLALFLLLLADGYDVAGTLVPAARASVSLHGSTSPYHASVLGDASGRFRFKGVAAGAYTLIVFVPGLGETRKTIEVGPGTADTRRRVHLVVRLDESKMTPDRSSVVSLKDLAIPDAARREYDRASKKLNVRDVAAAEAHLRRAVEIAPAYAAAWNHLGTIAYQTRRYELAEQHFRRSLEADEAAYEPLVNLGGVLVTLGRYDDAWNFNLHAVLRRPADALAQSQMGMTYYGLGKLDLAEKYLLEAIRLDPGHFSHPQLLLAEICLRRADKLRAAAFLEDFLRRHPDWPAAATLREAISALRASPAA